MKRSRVTEEQIIAVLRENEAGAKAADLCRKYGMSEATLYNWKAKFGGMDVSDAKRLRTLEDENAKLKKLLAESMLDASALRELLTKNGRARRQARGCHSPADGVPDERTGRRQQCKRERARDAGPRPLSHGAPARPQGFR